MATRRDAARSPGAICIGETRHRPCMVITYTVIIVLEISGLSITSFGEDLAGNLYILDRAGGIYTLAQTE